MKKVLVLFAVSLFALLYSCGDNTQSIPPVEDATLYLTVQDAADATLLADAKATFGSAQSTTDSKGATTFKLKAGSHVLLVEKPDYASVRQVVGTNDLASGRVSVVDDIYQNVSLYKTNAGLTGTLYYKNAKGQDVPLANVTIRIDIEGSNLAVTSYDTTTNAKGEYTFKNLPAISGYSYKVYALGTTIDGVLYQTKQIASGYSLLPGIVASNGKLDYGTAPVAFVVLEYPKIIIAYENRDKALTLKFSEAVDTSQFKSSWVSVSGTKQAINIKWLCASANACTQLELSPLPVWIDGTRIELRGIKSISGQTCSPDIDLQVLDINLSEVEVEGVQVRSTISQAKKDSIDYQDTKAKISWKEVAGATSYSVFVKTSDTTSYAIVKIGGSTITSETIAEVLINDGNPIGSKVNKVIVQAYNNGSKSLFSEPVEIEAKDDGKAPTYASSGPILDPCGDRTRKSDPLLGDYYGICKSGYKSPATGGDYTGYCKSNVSGTTDNTIKFCLNGEKEVGPEDLMLGNLSLEEILNDDRAFDKERVPGVKTPIIAYGNVFFSKPMDISVKKLSPGCTSTPTGACDKLKLAAEWNNDQNLSLTLTTVPGFKINTAADITFSIAGLKGKNNIAFVANPGVTPAVNEVKIKFIAEPDCKDLTDPVYGECRNYCNTNKGRNDYTHCFTEACNNNQAGNTRCPGYCNTTTGLADYTNCLTQACNNNMFDHPECPNYCSYYGYSDYANCPAEACAYYPNNSACVGYPGYCSTATGRGDYINCMEQACGNNANNAVCGDYCFSAPTGTICAGYCNANPLDSRCPSSCLAGSTDFVNCLDEACNALTPPNNDVKCKDRPGSTYCATPTGLTDYTNCANEICSEATAFDSDCADWCSEGDRGSETACDDE